MEITASMITARGRVTFPREGSILLPSRRGIVGAIVLLATILGPCIYVLKFRSNIHPIATAEAEQIGALTPEGVRQVHFGDRFTLRGVHFEQNDTDVQLVLIWESRGTQRLRFHTAVHLVDDLGTIRSQADYEQDSSKSKVASGVLWRDTISLARTRLTGISAIAIGLLDGKEWLIADRGPRDWGNRRLIIPLPKSLAPPIKNPAAPESAQGFLEVANCQQIVGWVWDRAVPGQRLEVEILEGDRKVAHAIADQFRPDLLSGKIGDGRYCFRLSMPAELKDGTSHSVHARVVKTGFELKGSPKTITCDSPDRK